MRKNSSVKYKSNNGRSMEFTLYFHTKEALIMRTGNQGYWFQGMSVTTIGRNDR